MQTSGYPRYPEVNTTEGRSTKAEMWSITVWQRLTCSFPPVLSKIISMMDSRICYWDITCRKDQKCTVDQSRSIVEKLDPACIYYYLMQPRIHLWCRTECCSGISFSKVISIVWCTFAPYLWLLSQVGPFILLLDLWGNLEMTRQRVRRLRLQFCMCCHFHKNLSVDCPLTKYRGGGMAGISAAVTPQALQCKSMLTSL